MEEFLLRLTISLPGLLLAIVFHEAAHAFMAYKFGDRTAMYAGRLTLNPVPHIDPFGTIILPLIGAVFGGFMFGYAKPVPVDFRALKNTRVAIFWISFAGPIANILITILCTFLLAFLYTQIGPGFMFHDTLTKMLYSAIQINIIIAVFNLIPFPPLDGSKMVSSFLSYENMVKYEGLARYSMLFILLLIFTNVLSYIMTPAMILGQAFLNFMIYLMS